MYVAHVNDESVNLVDKGIDAAETDAALGRRRTVRNIAIAGVAVVALAGGALAVVQPWADDGDESADRPSGTTAPHGGGTTAVAGDLPYVVLDGVPDGLELLWASGPSTEGGPWVDDLGGAEQSVLLVAAPGATFGDGPWVSVSVQLLDRFERASFDPASYLSGPDGPATTVRVGDSRGAIAENWWGEGSALLFGPVNDGFAVSVNGLGVSDDDLLRLAAEITLEERGDMADAVLGPAAAGLGLEFLAAYTEASYGLGGGLSVPLMSGGPGMLNANWAEMDGSEQVSLMVQPMPGGMDLATLGRFYLAGAEDVQIGPWAGVAGDFEIFGGSEAAVAWTIDGAVVLVSGSLPLDDLVEVAATARVTDAAEWGALVDEANANGGFEPAPDVPTWLIDAGEFDDGTTWLVEGAVDDRGLLLLCSASVSQFSSWSSCGESVEADQPVIATTGSFDVAAAAAVVGIVGADEADDGTTLRCVTDTGSVVEAPVHSVRDDWPMHAAALVLTEAGMCEVRAGDGTVLVTREISEADLVLGGIGIATPETIVVG